MGCGDTAPVRPDQEFRSWTLIDPHGADLEMVRLIRDEVIENSVLLVEELKLRK